MAEVSSSGAVVAVRGTFAVTGGMVSVWPAGHSFLSCEVVLSPCVWAAIRKVASHPTAMAVLVPDRGLWAGLVPMGGKTTAGTMPSRTAPLEVALEPTEHTGGSLPWGGAAPDQMSCLVAVITGQTTISGVVAAGA